MQIQQISNQHNKTFGLRPRTKGFKGYKDILEQTAKIIDLKTKDWNMGHKNHRYNDIAYDLNFSKDGLEYLQYGRNVPRHIAWFDRKTANELLSQPVEKIADVLVNIMNIFRKHDEAGNITTAYIENMKNSKISENIQDFDEFALSIVNTLKKHLKPCAQDKPDEFLSKAKIIFEP